MEDKCKQGISCILCKDKAVAHLYQIESYELLKCKECGFVFTVPRPSNEELRSLYKQDYYSEKQGTYGYNVNYVKAVYIRKSEFSKILRIINKHSVRDGNLLDIGCAHGFFLDIARSNGWKTWGVDISPDAVRFAKRKLGLNIFEGTLEQASYPSKFFDVITMLNFIEHCIDPLSIIFEVNRILKIGGLAAILTPDIESKLAIKKAQNWNQIKPPEHLNYFSRNTIRKLLEERGFQIKKIEVAGGLGIVTKARKAAFPTDKILSWYGNYLWLLKGISQYIAKVLKVGDMILVVARKKKDIQTGC